MPSRQGQGWQAAGEGHASEHGGKPPRALFIHSRVRINKEE
jgi:hypothetical protein